MERLWTEAVEVFVTEEPEVIQGMEGECGPGLDNRSSLITVVGELHVAEISVLQRDPSSVKEAIHD